nr:MAG TPA: minor structural protein [Caudoviricetes sp.]DAO87697.1 MAG TPA: minor structural protein [Caudoviricetes sp.]DAR05827.1 MAG TPA: minor structural protein [Caudoviricetes sp.]
MKTEELLSIGLTEEQANKILAMNGKDIEKHKKAAEDAKADKEALEQQVTDRDKDIAELKKASGDVAKIQEKLDELQGKYDKETEAYKAQLAQRDYQNAIDKAIAASGVKFSSKSAEKAFRAGIGDSKLEMKDGALDGFDKYLEKAKSEDPSAFVKAGTRIDTQGRLEGGGGNTPPTTLLGALHEKYDK